MKEMRQRKERLGRVRSDKGQKTISVVVERRALHPVYGKSMKFTKAYLVHDENNSAHVGDLVKIRESRPLSKNKRFTLVEVVERNKRAAVTLKGGESVVAEVIVKKERPVVAPVESQS